MDYTHMLTACVVEDKDRYIVCTENTFLCTITKHT